MLEDTCQVLGLKESHQRSCLAINAVRYNNEGQPRYAHISGDSQLFPDWIGGPPRVRECIPGVVNLVKTL